jgi:hypothetical protein
MENHTPPFPPPPHHAQPTMQLPILPVFAILGFMSACAMSMPAETNANRLARGLPPNPPLLRRGTPVYGTSSLPLFVTLTNDDSSRQTPNAIRNTLVTSRE